MSDEIWEELDEYDISKNNGKTFRAQLESAELEPSLADEVIKQVMEMASDDHNIIFIFTDDGWVVTGIHVPDAALNGESGPMLIRGSNPRHIIAAFSETEIRKKITSFDELEVITPGLKQDSADDENLNIHWMQELEKMSAAVMIKLHENPPETWEDLLK